MNKPIGAYTRVSQKSLKKVAEKRNKRVNEKLNLLAYSYLLAGFVIGILLMYIIS